MTEQEYIVAAFRSRQQVMKFVREMEKMNLKVRVINTPREIAIGCGLSASFDEKDYKEAKAIVDRTHPTAFVGFYHAVAEGVKLIIKPLYKKFEM